MVSPQRRGIGRSVHCFPCLQVLVFPAYSWLRLLDSLTGLKRDRLREQESHANICYSSSQTSTSPFLSSQCSKSWAGRGKGKVEVWFLVIQALGTYDPFLESFILVPKAISFHRQVGPLIAGSERLSMASQPDRWKGKESKESRSLQLSK